MNEDRLEDDLHAWDGKSVSRLQAIYKSAIGLPDLVARLIELCARPETEVGATWLLKHHLERQDLTMTATDSIRVAGLLSDLSDWQAQLHLFQIADRSDMTQGTRPAWEAFIRAGLMSDRKLIRAWSYYALAVLAARFTDLRAEARGILQDAMDQETAGSIKVRLRKALGKLSG
ncbi:MAG: hypothetical protein JJ902_17740 [Roseibium sp.]|nr:hypothetical protein [Roseibium sp.]